MRSAHGTTHLQRANLSQHVCSAVQAIVQHEHRGATWETRSHSHIAIVADLAVDTVRSNQGQKSKQGMRLQLPPPTEMLARYLPRPLLSTQTGADGWQTRRGTSGTWSCQQPAKPSIRVPEQTLNGGQLCKKGGGRHTITNDNKSTQLDAACQSGIHVHKRAQERTHSNRLPPTCAESMHTKGTPTNKFGMSDTVSARNGT